MRSLRNTILLGATLVAPLAWTTSATPLSAQQQPDTTIREVAKVVVEPTSLSMKAGDLVPLKVTALDAQGKEIPNARIRVSGPRTAFAIGGGQVKALEAGRFEIVASAGGGTSAAPVVVRIPVTVTWPDAAMVTITPEPGRLYTGVTLAHTGKVLHADGSERRGAPVTWRSSNPAVATVDRFGNVTAVAPGATTITAESEGQRSQVRHTVVPNPIARLTIDVGENVGPQRRRPASEGDAASRGRSGRPRRPDHVELYLSPGRHDRRARRDGDRGSRFVRRRGPGPLHAARDRGRDERAQGDPGDPARRAPENQRHRARQHLARAHVRPVAVDGQGRPRLRARRYVGRRRLGYVFDITNLAAPVITDSIKVDARDDQRRDGLPRRTLRRVLARGRVEPGQRRRHSRPREPGAPEGRCDLQPGADGRRAQHVRHERLSVCDLERGQVRHRRCQGHLQSEIPQ